jgi:histidine ammonia-lyase
MNPRQGPAQAPASLILDGAPLTPAQVEQVARHARPVALGPAALEAMRSSRAIVEARLSDGLPHYGINTGFGSLSRQRIPDPQLRDLQTNLIRSHAAGVGPPLPPDVVRAMMLLLAASLARGRSGVRPLLAERLVALLNSGITPAIPETGSVGASGDLAPLAHLALALIGEAQTRSPSNLPPAHSASANVPFGNFPLDPKEGLALINGTHLMAAQAALLLQDLDRLTHAATLATAMSIDACRGTDAFLDPRIYHARNQPGPRAAAERLRNLLAGSQIVQSHKSGDPRVQDPYSLRCAPIILGAAMDAIAYARAAIEAELGAVTDNPLVFGGTGLPPAPSAPPPLPAAPAIISAGNFHGMPLAIPLDTLAIALSHIAGISERRTFYLLSAGDPQTPVPPYLSPAPGLHSGLMIAQYTAAACCNEIIGLSAPASVANIPTSAGMEDYNSFGPRSAAKARRALELCRQVVAIELLCSAQALEHHRPLRSGDNIEAAHATIRAHVAPLTADRPPAPDIAAIAQLIESGGF